MAQRKLYRSKTDRFIAGVAGGLAEYFNIESVLVRLIFVLIFFWGGAGILAYIILWIVITEKPNSPGADKKTF
jgi:phage shock protein PspC (stress-responsive transcriptional regulator)